MAAQPDAGAVPDGQPGDRLPGPGQPTTGASRSLEILTSALVAERERASRSFQVPEDGECDAAEWGGAATMLDGRCRCIVCARCGHHTGNAHQGHHWDWCKVTHGMRESHFCCPDPVFGCELEAPPPPVAAALDLASASAHVAAALGALGARPRDPGDDRETARRVHGARPGVPLHHALAAVEVLRAMGWEPAAALRARVEAAEAKLAEVRAYCREREAAYSDAGSRQTLAGILAIIGSEEEARNGDRS